MSVKLACSTWFAMYVVAAVFLGHLVYHRLPKIGEAFVSGIVGGGIASMGLLYLGGIWTKIAEALRLRRSMDRQPADGQTIVVVGTIVPLAPTLLSPCTGRPCVAYKYEVRYGDALLYDGFALAPSAIDSQHGRVRILAYPDLQVAPSFVRHSDGAPNFSEYIERTAFREPPAPKEAPGAAFDENDGSVRTDTRWAQGAVALDYATFKEWSLAPGDRVYAIGFYSQERGGFVSERVRPVPVILRDSPRGLVRRSIVGAFASLGGAALFLGIVAAGVLALYVFVPLSATEQMAPDRRTMWREVRMDRLIERRIRVPMRSAGLLDISHIVPDLESGSARGRVTAGGRDIAVSSADESRLGDMTIIRIDDGVVTLTVDSRGRPLRLRFGNDDVDASTFARDLDVEIEQNWATYVVGRFTYFRDDAESPACRVTFYAVP